MIDRHSERLARLRHAILESPGRSTTAARTAAAGGGTLPEPLRSYVAKVRDESYRISDRDIDTLKAAGHSEDEVFELTIAAALGAALCGFDAGMAALREGH